MSKFKLLVILLLSMLFLSYIFSGYFYEKTEAENEKRLYSRCLVYSISELLNERYVNDKNYPEVDEYKDFIKENKNKIKCGSVPNIGNGHIIDGFGDSMCYRRISNENIFVFSRNVFSFEPDKRDFIFAIENSDGVSKMAELPKHMACQ